ncbi:translation initiation factor eIF-2B subunit epsilon-like isoform X2 [Centruroides sculpturatus]|uniref:translation initiation factor eIF-2B subunit epsilon-like isoform X2 n=1 Tax=Centruroides sculpturatus TaxID=218467 RepID=UPI000C6E257B|nr:translation initiation factor eIF-2B subunit epsilon-like isoform X2 [Centruroides sculpturatus]
MAENSKKKAKDNELLKQEEIIRAVIVADSFDARFQPLTQNTPRVLLPLVNCPMLDYILESLCLSGVQEVYVFCCAFGQQVKNHIQKSKWSSPVSPMTVTTILSETFLSMGDVLRELDSQGLIRTDFILINGNVISNLPLAEILEEHKRNRQKDKGTVMTLVYRTALPKHHSRCLEDEVVVCVDRDTNRVYFLQKVGNQKKIKFPLSIFQDHGNITIRHDLLDCHICICSPQVPLLYSDNFDYQNHEDFVRGILFNEEILGNSIYLHVAETGYAAQVSNFFMYDSISQDIIRRWVHPIVPDVLAMNGGRYSYLRHNVYKQKDIDLARGCILEKNVVIAQGTKIGTNTRIYNSVIGSNCKIGNNVTIENSYLWNNVEIGDSCNLRKCILADNVLIKQNVKILPGCVLSDKVIVGPDITLPECTLLQYEFLEELEDFAEDIISETPKDNASNVALIGIEGHGVCYQKTNNNFPESEILDIWGQSINSDDEMSSIASSNVDELSDGVSPVPDDTNMFYAEVLDSLQRGVEEKIKCENLILEINSSKYAYNVTMKEVNMLVMKAILELPNQKSDVSPQEYFLKLKPLLLQFMPLIKNYIKSEESQMDCIIALEIFAISNENDKTALLKILHLLYEKDILPEEVILKWYQHPSVLTEHDPAQQKDIRKQVEYLYVFIHLINLKSYNR